MMVCLSCLLKTFIISGYTVETIIANAVLSFGIL
eukprot:SAG31_NODE_40092_length_283_cov_0.847826_1_plen_33_part_10